MQYYSTARKSPNVTLTHAIMHSEAPDGGIYLPASLPKLPRAFFNNISEMSPTEISYFVANSLFGSQFSSSTLKRIGEQTFSFPMPLVKIEEGIYVMELFHGPTLNVKDISGKFTALLLSAIRDVLDKPLNLLVSTNGNSGIAVSMGCVDLPLVNVFALYPKATPEHLSAQISGIGRNVHAVRVNGTIDDCRRMVCAALKDQCLNSEMLFSCANSVNLGRILPHIICYFQAYAQLAAQEPKHGAVYMSVPTGNGGGLMAAYMAMQMGMPLTKLVSACNENAAFARFMETGKIESCPPASKRTLAYAMDTCRPTNLPRFIDICKGNMQALRDKIVADVCTDAEIRATIADVHRRTGYVLDPHAAVAYKALKQNLPAGATGIVTATAHPARSAAVVSEIIGKEIEVPAQLRPKPSATLVESQIPSTFPALKKFILNTLKA